MPRFFALASNIGKSTVVLGEDDAKHLRALRISIGDTLIICDSNGTDYSCRIVRLDRNGVEAEIIFTAPSESEPSVYCTIYAAYPKGDKVETIIQKCTELGASEFVFFQSARCVSRPRESALAKKLDRWNKIAREAAGQSGRGRIPTVSTLDSFGEMLDHAEAQSPLRLFMYEAGERVPLSGAIPSQTESAAIITGSEGGFESYEAAAALAKGFSVCSMGARILRCETAPLTALTALMLITGNLD